MCKCVCVRVRVRLCAHTVPLRLRHEDSSRSELHFLRPGVSVCVRARDCVRVCDCVCAYVRSCSSFEIAS